MLNPVLEPQEGATNKNTITSPLTSFLPSIPYNREELQEIIDELPVASEIISKLTEYLNHLEKQVSDIKRYQSKKNLENFYDSMRAAILDIHNIANEIYELIKVYHLSLPNALKRLILKWITPLEEELKKRLEMPEDNRKEFELKTKRLYAEQSFIIRQAYLQQALIRHLSGIKELLIEPGKPSPRCYISYAWPSKGNKESEYWIQPFLVVLYEHLKAAGIRVIMDIRDNNPGDSIYQFMQQYHEGNYIILIGTESLLKKYYSITNHAIKTELSIISDRFEQDYKQYGQSRIYPLLVSGTIKKAYPEIYDKYHTIRDGRESGYVGTLKRLIDWIYESRINQSKLKYEELWQSFYKDLPELSNSLEAVEQELRFGYHRQRLEYLKEDVQYQSVQAQEEAKYSPAVSAKMIGVLMESTGNNPKTLFDEHGIQFQRPYSNPDFVKRQALWKKMVQHFAQKEQQILTLTAHGLGGMGKTELAQHYFIHPPRPYTLRAWFNAERKEYLYQQYIELGSANGIKFLDEMPVEEKAKRVKNWLEQQKDCLLVYDNVPTAKEVEELLPNQGKHHILMTSRNEIDWHQHQKLDVDVMEEHEAIALIIKIIGRYEEENKLKELVKILGYLPLALAQAGAYITVKALRVGDYLQRYQLHQTTLLIDNNSRSPKHEAAWITFNINFEALKVDCPEALMTLKQAGWLSHAAIPEQLLQAMIDNKDSKPIDLLWDDIKECIRRYSLMRIDVERQELNMHPLLQDILRKQQEKAEQVQIIKQICAVMNNFINYYDKQGSLKYKVLISHAEQLNQNIQIITQSSKVDGIIEPSLRLLTIEPVSLDVIYHNIGLPNKILSFCRKKLEVYELYYGKDHPKVARVLVNLGVAHGTLGDFIQQKRLLKRALVINEHHYGKESLEVANTLTNLGTAYIELGIAEKAKEILERALIINEHHYGELHPEVAKNLINLGTAYSNLGNYKLRKEILERALIINEQYYGKDHPEMAITLTNLGNAYSDLGDVRKAKEFLEQALVINERHYGKDHPKVANTLTNVGNVYNKLNQSNQAKESLERALVIDEVYYSKDHPKVAITLTNLGVAYHNLGNVMKAKAFLERSLAIKERYYGKDHPEVGICLINLSNVYSDLSDANKAKELLERALTINERHYGKYHLQVAIILTNLGNVYDDLGDVKKAQEFLEQALLIKEHHYGKEHLEVAKALTNLGVAYSGLGNFKQAKAVLERALSTQEKCQGKEHSTIATILINLGNVYGELGDTKQKIELLDRALLINERHYGKEHPQSAIIALNLANAHFNLGQIETALSLAKRAYNTFSMVYGPQHSHTQLTVNLIMKLQSFNFNISLLNTSMHSQNLELAQQRDNFFRRFNENNRENKANEATTGSIDLELVNVLKSSLQLQENNQNRTANITGPNECLISDGMVKIASQITDIEEDTELEEALKLSLQQENISPLASRLNSLNSLFPLQQQELDEESELRAALEISLRLQEGTTRETTLSPLFSSTSQEVPFNKTTDKHPKKPGNN